MSEPEATPLRRPPARMHRGHAWADRTFGLLLAMFGVAILLALGILLYLRPAGHESDLVRLGMPLTLLVATVGELAVMVGLWLALQAGRAGR